MTIRDLAKLSGYSLGTVSRALNHQPNVSAKAREQILALAQQYGFEINSNAQSLKKQNSDSLLVIVKGSANELFARMVEVVGALPLYSSAVTPAAMAQTVMKAEQSVSHLPTLERSYPVFCACVCRVFRWFWS